MALTNVRLDCSIYFFFMIIYYLNTVGPLIKVSFWDRTSVFLLFYEVVAQIKTKWFDDTQTNHSVILLGISVYILIQILVPLTTNTCHK